MVSVGAVPGSDPYRDKRTAQSFGTDAARYDRRRSGYPEALVQRIVTSSPGRSFLDVGCGTGIAARQFQAAGCQVLGVEPDERMAAFARQAGVPAEVATFESWEPAGRTFDAVVCGTAWHWVDPVAGAAKAGQVLRAGGRLALCWNVYQLPSRLAEASAAVYQRVVPDSPFDFEAARTALDSYEPIFARTADGIRTAGRFSDPQRWRFGWEQTYTRDEWLDRLPTSGAFTTLPPGQLSEVLAGIGAAIDALGGTFVLPYTTVTVTAVRTRPPRH
jgi:SAM-dependent methyltransferase